MRTLQQNFTVNFSYNVYFTTEIFNPSNELLKDVLHENGAHTPVKVLIVIDDGIIAARPSFGLTVRRYFEYYKTIFSLVNTLVITGGETAKNNPQLIENLLKQINASGLCRHSYIIGIGGGAVLDTVGYAAAIAHRGIRHVRIPTTVLAQNDSGVGVKNGINTFGKKNFTGTFAPPFAVINDFNFLTSLDERNWRSGISEAIKVALIKDNAFFNYIEKNADALVKRNKEAMQYLIHRCAELHLNHISSGDPFEKGSSRPLDFGHWAAHKLEQLTAFSITHGEAVAIGIGLDSTYSYLSGMISEEEWLRILDLNKKLQFNLYIPEMFNYLDDPENDLSMLKGLAEFREHIGGKLAIMLLEKIGKGKEVDQVDYKLVKEAVLLMKEYQTQEKIIS
jgi:3-dehydroquinate synthase